MNSALNKTRSVIENSLAYLLTNDLNTFSHSNALSIDDIRIDSSNNNRPGQVLVELSDAKSYQTVVIFNSLINKRNEIVRFRVNTPNIEVIRNSDNKKLDVIQVSLVWANIDEGPLSQNHIPDRSVTEQNEPALDFQENLFELLFEVDIDPLSTKSFTIKLAKDSNQNKRQSGVDFYFKTLDKSMQDTTLNEFIKK